MTIITSIKTCNLCSKLEDFVKPCKGLYFTLNHYITIYIKKIVIYIF